MNPDLDEVRWFGARLKELREEAGLTQAQLAERAGLNGYTVSRSEQGERAKQGEPGGRVKVSVTWGTVVALCKALGVTPDAFWQAPQGFGRASDPASKAQTARRSRAVPKGK